jgi:phosphohistidine phosphatase SixA
MLTRLVAALMLTCVAAADAAAQPTVFLVRHAERADGGAAMMDTDPDLSDAGRARAETLAFMLKSANITTIIATQYKRTQQTAEPLAKGLGIQVTTVHSDAVAKLPPLVRASSGNVLIVGHSGSVPKALSELGVPTPVTLEESEYDNLFIVTMTAAEPRMVRLHFR